VHTRHLLFTIEQRALIGAISLAEFRTDGGGNQVWRVGMAESVLGVHGARALHAFDGHRPEAKLTTERSGEGIPHVAEGTLGFSFRIKPDRRRGPNPFAGAERRHKNDVGVR
jgi:hypothetical protein